MRMSRSGPTMLLIDLYHAGTSLVRARVLSFAFANARRDACTCTQFLTESMKWLRRLDALVNHVHVAGVNSAIPEQAEAWELQELQRKLTGGASGYRPASVTPWIWDTDQTVEGVRWSYSHTRELTLTANVARGGSVSPLPLAVHQLELDKVRFRSPTRDVYAEKTPTTAVREVQVPYTVDSMLAATHADAFLVLHRGAIVAERYLHGTTARTKRLGMSMTKSYTSMLIGLLVQRGE